MHKYPHLDIIYLEGLGNIKLKKSIESKTERGIHMSQSSIRIFELNNAKKHDGIFDTLNKKIIVPSVGEFYNQDELEAVYATSIVTSFDRETIKYLSEMGFKSKFTEEDSRTVSVHVDGTIYQSFIDKILKMEAKGYKVSLSQVIYQTITDGIKYEAIKKKGSASYEKNLESN